MIYAENETCYGVQPRVILGRNTSERLANIGVTPSVGRVGSSYDNALVETVIELFKTEVIRRQVP